MKKLLLLSLLLSWSFNVAFAQFGKPSDRSVIMDKTIKPIGPILIPTSGLRVTLEIVNPSAWIPASMKKDANGQNMSPEPLNLFKFHVYKTNVENVNNGFVKTVYNHTEVSGFKVYPLPESTTFKRFADGKDRYNFIISGLEKGQNYSVDLENFGFSNGINVLITDFAKTGNAVPSNNTISCSYSVVDGKTVIVTVSQKKITETR